MPSAKVDIADLSKWAKLAIEKRNAAPAKQRLLLGIAGCPGAGKSTFASELVERINLLEQDDVAALVPMDGFHLSNEELDKIGLLPFKGIPDSFDAASFVQLIEQLKHETDKPVLCPVFDRSIEASIADGITIKPEVSIVVVEGNYLLLEHNPWHKLRDLFNEIWYLDVPMETILPRLVKRHIEGGKDEQGAREKVRSTDLPNAQLVEQFKDRADHIIKSSQKS